VQRVLTHYERQPEEEAVAEEEAAYEDSTQAMMEVPRELLPPVRELLAKRRADEQEAASGGPVEPLHVRELREGDWPAVLAVANQSVAAIPGAGPQDEFARLERSKSSREDTCVAR
jgi:hypothetical protein